MFRDGCVLLAKRSLGTHLGGLWEFPGGKLEAEEDYQDCLRREVREELGIEIRVDSFLIDVEHSYPEREVQIRFFRCTIESGEPEPLACAELNWVTPLNLGHYQFVPADLPVLRLLEERKELWSDETWANY